MLCRAHLGEIRDHYQLFMDKKATVVAITFATPTEALKLSEELKLPFELACDTKKEVYKSFELGSARLGDFFYPSVLFKFLGRILTGWLPSLDYSKEDLFQLGGDMVININGEVVYRYKSTDPADRPSIKSLLEQLEKASKKGD